MNLPHIDHKYILPEEQPDPWPPRWQIWIAVLVVAALVGWMAGHCVGWVGQ